jgi:hypothetical protein
MKMRQRKRARYAHMMLGLKIRELLDELDDVADVLAEAMRLENASDSGDTPPSQAATGTAPSR